MKKHDVVPHDVAVRHINNLYRLYGVKRYTSAAKLAILQKTMPVVGRFLCLYEVDRSLTKDFLDDIVPAYKSVEDDESIGSVYDSMFTVIRRIRNRLGGQ